MHQLVQAWPVAQRGELASAWRVSWKRLQRAAHPWMVVAGPMAALQAYLMEMQWNAGVIDDWVRAVQGVRPAAQMNLEHPWPYLQQQLHKELAVQRAQRIQALEHCFPMMRMPDWTIYHRVVKRLNGTRKAAVDAWTQGSLRTHTHGGRAVCPLCNAPVTMKHLIWECSYHEKQLPAGWTQLIAANEDSMLWARGLIERPDYRPTVGVESIQVTGMLEGGWPIRISPSQRIALGVKATCQDGRLKRYAVAVTIGQWKQGSWQVEGTCTALTPGDNNEARAWVFGCWIALLAIVGRHQINVPHRAGWQVLQKGDTSVLVADLWHNLEATEWKRLLTLHVPAKLLRGEGGEQRGWHQYQAAQQCAHQRALVEAPLEQLHALQEADQWHEQVYQVAAERIGALLQDKQHYMHDKLEGVEPVIKLKEKAPKGRLEIMQQLANRKRADGVAGVHCWVLKGSGLQCSACGMHLKASSTHDEIARKDGAPCAGIKKKTLMDQMKELIESTAALPEEQDGHRWALKAHTFHCQRCWVRVPVRCSKEALEAMTQQECHFGEVHEGDLNWRTRVHSSHRLQRRGAWIVCLRCSKQYKLRDGHVPHWLQHQCPQSSGQTKLVFGSSSS